MTAKKFKVSDESKNSKGIIIRTAGIKTDRFMKNPVMLNFHDRKDVLGKWTGLEKKSTEMYAEPVFDLADPEAAKIAGKVEREFMNGSSLGLTPIEYHYNLEEDAIDVTVSELKEISICSIPSNENSLLLFDENGEEMSDTMLLQLKDDLQKPIQQNMKNKAHLAKVLNLADTCEESDILLAVQATIDENKTLKADLKTKADALEAIEKQKVITLVDDAVKANKILPGDKDDYLKLANADFDTTKKLLDAKAPHVSVAERLKNGEKGGEDRSTWTFADYQKKDSDALADMKENNKAEYDRLFNAYYKKK